MICKFLNISGLILIIATLLFVTVFPLLMQKYYPNKMWLGIILCLCTITGQLYLPGGVKYLIGLLIFGFILSRIPPIDNYILIKSIIFHLLSAVIIYWRFSKLNKSVKINI
jgi:hypothetical protein